MAGLGAGFVEGRLQFAQIGIGAGHQGQGLLLIEAAFDHARQLTVGVQHGPGGIDAHAQRARQAAAVVNQHGQRRVVQAPVPLLELAGFFLAQMAGRSQGDEVGAGKARVFGPALGFLQLRQAQRAPAGPELDERGPPRFQVGSGGLARHVMQRGQPALQRGGGRSGRSGGSGARHRRLEAGPGQRGQAGQRGQRNQRFARPT